jgi:hypothetical protein
MKSSENPGTRCLIFLILMERRRGGTSPFKERLRRKTISATKAIKRGFQDLLTRTKPLGPFQAEAA